MSRFRVVYEYQGDASRLASMTASTERALRNIIAILERRGVEYIVEEEESQS